MHPPLERDGARSVAGRLRRVYGAGPVHLCLSAVCLALIGLSLAAWLHPAGSGSAAASGSSGGAGGAMAGMDMSPAAHGTAPAPRTGARCTARACPILAPGPGDLSVAGQLGSALAALWVTPAGGTLHGRLELLTPNMGPVHEVPHLPGATSVAGCGPGCWTFTLPGDARTLRVSARQQGRRYAVTLPTRWERGQAAAARQILHRAVATMQALPGVRVDETLTAGPPGPVERLSYRFSAPDRMAYTMNTGARNVTIGSTTWSFTPGQGWQRSSYGSGAFTTRSWYDWTQYEQSIQLLGGSETDGRRTADLALMDPRLPVWFRLHVDLQTGRVGSVLMIAGGHFMTDRYRDFGTRQRITAPAP